MGQEQALAEVGGGVDVQPVRVAALRVAGPLQGGGDVAERGEADRVVAGGVLGRGLAIVLALRVVLGLVVRLDRVGVRAGEVGEPVEVAGAGGVGHLGLPPRGRFGEGSRRIAGRRVGRAAWFEGAVKAEVG